MVPPITGNGSGGDGFDSVALVEYVESLQSISEQSFEVVEYNHELINNPGGSYGGAVYAPTLDRVYFVPRGISGSPVWHYIDCAQNGLVMEYNHPAGIVVNAYVGGVYAPLLDRIYFVPYQQTKQAQWHYIDCLQNGLVIAYEHGLTTAPVLNAYQGGVYAPTLDRIYFVPWAQADEMGNNWHYIDCEQNGLVVEYNHGLATRPVNNAYYGGVYTPDLDRIYFVPDSQGYVSTKIWHYIDCAQDGLVVPYNHGLSTRPSQWGPFYGGVYAPTLQRIYFVPHQQSNDPNWHYIDCAQNGLVVEYFHDLAVMPSNVGYRGAVYVPTLDRIYLVPDWQAELSTWHYIDCAQDGLVVAYNHQLDNMPLKSAFFGGAYAPTLGRVYFSPLAQATSVNKNWQYIQVGPVAFNISQSGSLMSGAMFNKL